VPACGDEPIEGWFEVLDPVLYPQENARRCSKPAPGCPGFGEESVLGRGPKGKPPVAGSVRPGLHMPTPDGAPVVWWDPAVLALEVEELAPLRHQRILEMDADVAAAAESQRNYAAWKTEREVLLAKASEPSLSVQTVTSLVRAQAATAAGGATRGHAPRSQSSVDIEIVERSDRERPSGRRFGVLVHALLATIDLSADADAIQAAASVQGRIVGATEDEMNAAIATVGGVLKHPILRRAAASADKGGLRRETPILLALDDGVLVEGVVDLAFRDDMPDFTGWTVVDFKTNREFEESSGQYIAQVSLYSKAVGAATHSPTRGILLVV
jgi:ATP-dependent helicase/nuclease subunit A